MALDTLGKEAAFTPASPMPGCGFGGPRGGRRGPKCKRGKTKAQPAEGDMPEAGHPHPKNIHTSASPKSHEIGV